MIIDLLINFFIQYRFYIILGIVIAKFLVLFWYKPHRPSYAFSNFFRYYSRFDKRDDKPSRWKIFITINNPLSIALYISVLVSVLSLIMFLMQKKVLAF